MSSSAGSVARAAFPVRADCLSSAASPDTAVVFAGFTQEAAANITVGVFALRLVAGVARVLPWFAAHAVSAQEIGMPYLQRAGAARPDFACVRGAVAIHPRRTGCRRDVVVHRCSRRGLRAEQVAIVDDFCRSLAAFDAAGRLSLHAYSCATDSGSSAFLHVRCGTPGSSAPCN